MKNFIPIVISACLLIAVVTGCEKDGGKAPSQSSSPEKEVAGHVPAGSVNVALEKSYTVNPEPNGYVKTYRTDATDGRKPLAKESCFGYSGRDKPLEVTLDIDLGAAETINGAALYTFLDEYDEENNSCGYGAGYVEVYGSDSGSFSGEEALLGSAGDSAATGEQPGSCISDVAFPPHECRFVRFLITKQLGAPSHKTDWLFIKEAEVWGEKD